MITIVLWDWNIASVFFFIKETQRLFLNLPFSIIKILSNFSLAYLKNSKKVKSHSKQLVLNSMNNPPYPDLSLKTISLIKIYKIKIPPLQKNHPHPLENSPFPQCFRFLK